MVLETSEINVQDIQVIEKNEDDCERCKMLNCFLLLHMIIDGN